MAVWIRKWGKEMNQIEVFKVDSCGNDGDDGQKKKKE